MKRFDNSDFATRTAPRKRPPEGYRYTRPLLRAIAAVLDLFGTRALRTHDWLTGAQPGQGLFGGRRRKQSNRLLFQASPSAGVAGAERSEPPVCSGGQSPPYESRTQGGGCRADRPVRSILLVQLDHLGDAILSTAMLPLLHRRFPGAAIDVLASSWNRIVFETNPHVRRVVVSNRNWFARSRSQRGFVREAFVHGKQLRRWRYDLGIDVRGDLLVSVLLWIAGIPRRLGSGAGGGAFLLTDCPPWVSERHELASRLALLEPLGIRPNRNEGRPQMFPAPADRAAVERRLKAVRDPNRPLMVLHVGAGTEAKRWPLAHQRELIRQLLKRDPIHEPARRKFSSHPLPSPHFGLGRLEPRREGSSFGPQVILVGDPNERAIARRVAAGMAACDVIDWTGKLAVLELAALLEAADLFVGADSGPAHLAAWAKTRSVVLFSGTNQVKQWRPPSETLTVLQHPTDCSPCHLKRCVFSDHPCMTALTPDRVRSVLERIVREELSVVSG